MIVDFVRHLRYLLKYRTTADETPLNFFKNLSPYHREKDDKDFIFESNLFNLGNLEHGY